MDNLSYLESRIYEQAFMLYYNTPLKGNYKHNQINGISPKNPNKKYYSSSGFNLYRYISNQIDNEILNYLGY